MAHTPDFLAGLQKAAQTCDEQALKSGGVQDGPMAEDPADLDREAMAVGAHNAAAAIRELIDAPNEDTSAGDIEPLEPEFVRGLRKGAAFCDEIAGQCQTMANGRFVTPHGKALHETMGKGAAAAGDAVRALIPTGVPHALG